MAVKRIESGNRLGKARDEVSNSQVYMRKIHLSRRQFVKRAGAAIAVPFILPSHIWSAEVKPNDRIVLGSIGVGTQGRGLMGGFLGKKETQTVAVCDVDTNRREHAKKTVEDYYAKKT